MDEIAQVAVDTSSPAKVRAVAPLASHMSRLLGRAVAEAVQPLGLTPAQFAVLKQLWKEDGLTQSHLARSLDVEQATMANTLKRMVRDGLIARCSDPDDNRVTRLRLTDQARSLEVSAKLAVRGVNARALGGLSRKEQKRFVDMTSRVISALK